MLHGMDAESDKLGENTYIPGSADANYKKRGVGTYLGVRTYTECYDDYTQ